MNIKRILISSLLIASVTSMTSCDISVPDFLAKRGSSAKAAAKQTVYAPELDPDIHELITDQRFKSLENDEPVRFETAVTPEEAENGTAVELRDDSGKTISKMYDNGKHGDRIAGDGIYTCTYNPKAKGEDTFSYTANIGGTDTNSAQVRYFDKITDQDVEDMNNVGTKITEIQSKYLDSNGNIPDGKKAEAIDAVGEYAKELYNNGDAVEYRINHEYDNVIVKLSSGITMVYDNPSDNTEAGSGTTANAGAAGGNNNTGSTNAVTYEIQDLTIKGYKPYRYSCPWIGENLDQTMSGVVSEFSPDVTNGGIVESSDVGPHCIDTFGPNQVIIWRGHGGYDGKIHSFLGTTRLFDPSEYTDEDIIEDRLLIASRAQNRVEYLNRTGQRVNDYDYESTSYPVYITSEYVDAHCPDMTDSFVFLGCCLGAKDSVLAASFINKNCNVVFGFTESVWSTYDNDIMAGLFDEMCKKRPGVATGYPVDYYSIEEALENAKLIYGEDDTVLYGTGDDPDNPKAAAKPMLFGNRNYRFAEAILGTNSSPAPNISVRGSLELADDYISIKVGENKLVQITSYPDDHGTMYWSINNSDVATVNSYGMVSGKSAGTTYGHVVTEDGLYYKDFTIIVTD